MPPVAQERHPPRLVLLSARKGLRPRAYLSDLLARAETVSAAAESAGVTRPTMYRWLELYGIQLIRARRKKGVLGK